MDDTRERLLEAATATFVAEGFDGARLQDIARRAGFTTGAVYGHFSGKAELFAEVVNRHGQEFRDDVLASLTSGTSPIEIIQELGVVMQADGPTAAHRLMVDACAVAARDETLRRQLDPNFEHVYTALGAVITKARRQGMIDRDVDPEALTNLCLVLMLGSFMVKAMGLEQPGAAGAEGLMIRLLGALTPPTLDLRDERGGLPMELLAPEAAPPSVAPSRAQPG